MDVVTVGGGPGGLYAGLLLKKARPEWSVTVYERNPPGVTYGWGIVFPERTLSNLAEADAPSHEAITEQYSKWEPFDVYRRGERYRSRGHTFASMLRADLLSVLGERCRELGVDLRFEREIEDVEELAAEADLLIGADGIDSQVRDSRADAFGTDAVEGETRFSWFGTEAEFEALSHIFVENDDGIWCAHTYPGKTSTFIVDCDAQTWHNARLDEMDEAAYLAYLESTFSEYLDGHELLSELDRWQRFRTIRNDHWYDGNVVLVGDAAHTAHYSIGSGTTLAMEDGIALAEAFDEHDTDVESALAAYEATRKPFTDGLQRSAERSRIHFENIRRFFDLPSRQFALHHLTRSGRISYGSLARRDPAFVDAFDEWFADEGPTVGPRTAVPGDGVREDAAPRERAWRCRDVTFPTRTVRTATPTLDAREGHATESSLAEMRALAGRDPGLVLTEPLAVAPSGRFSSGSPGLYDDDHVDAWGEVIADAGETPTGAHLVHAGRRSATGPRPFALERPGQRDDAWAPPRGSEFERPPSSFTPSAMDGADRDRVREAFVAAAGRADEAGFDYLQIHAGHGTLLWSYHSPLSNGSDDAGSDVDGRLRYPLSVVDSVRSVWPDEKPLGVTLQATDHARGGLTVGDAFVAAERLADAGVDVVAPVAGGHGGEESPDPVAGLGTYADDIRNEVGVPTMATRHATDPDEVDTLVGTGRADLVTYFG